jgi:hypothetical protein
LVVGVYLFCLFLVWAHIHVILVFEIRNCGAEGFGHGSVYEQDLPFPVLGIDPVRDQIEHLTQAFAVVFQHARPGGNIPLEFSIEQVQGERDYDGDGPKSDKVRRPVAKPLLFRGVQEFYEGDIGFR